MAFTDLDPQTQAQLDRDLAEAAGRGINGDVDAVVKSFEDTLAYYLTLPADVRRSYPRGETARIFGTALGAALVREHGFAWQLLIDDYGTDLVVARDVESSEPKYAAPLVIVDARFEDEEAGKLTTFVQQFL
ncbi:DUF3806 domain-containing protein [Corynebacterium sp. p3-SID1056]|uniref:DUF3806 domain-containing protein n=1 Tax=Corynebacterium sp. p3-SID1056 TaxID=2916092 RepID=UPI0021A6EA4B|nr:DUF3806 domain-containing protein [Corynebacterium sp. p3-SID1056]MCT2339056.1 DUF3806 domain-containing protein [Corynebacterium sp. p3-SID1056]